MIDYTVNSGNIFKSVCDRKQQHTAVYDFNDNGFLSGNKNTLRFVF